MNILNKIENKVINFDEWNIIDRLEIKNGK